MGALTPSFLRKPVTPQVTRHGKSKEEHHAFIKSRYIIDLTFIRMVWYSKLVKHGLEFRGLRILGCGRRRVNSSGSAACTRRFCQELPH